MNNYDNSEPKILKTLKSDGNVVDESGEVINETSDYWERVYEQSEPKVDKILHSDGTIKDAAGNLIQDTTDFNVEKYNQAEPIPAKYLHSDGTVNENPGGGSSADLEDNKEATIDVLTYTEPVEITPTAGKDGMKKTTITLDNIPSGGSTLYCWRWYDSQTTNTYLIYTLNPAPSVDDTIIICAGESGIPHAPNMDFKVVTYENNAITIDEPSLEEVPFERYSEGDIPLSPSPSGGSVTLYDWSQASYHYYLPFGVAPESLSMEELREIEYLQILNGEEIEKTTFGESFSALDYYKVSDTEFTFKSYSNTITVTRSNEPNDITVW